MPTEHTPGGMTIIGGNFEHLKRGDKVTRMLAGVIPMPMVVSAVTQKHVVCEVADDPAGAGIRWTFSRRNGAEIDEELGWDENNTGSYLVIRDSFTGPAPTNND